MDRVSIDWNQRRQAGDSLVEGQTLNTTLRRGWYLGSEEFREKLVAKLGKLKPGSATESRRKGDCAEQTRDHGQKEAERIIAVAVMVFGFKVEAWKSLRKGDWRKGLVIDQWRW